MLDGVAVVAIGRNEGERLKRCLASVAGRVPLVVYVDSGSTDGSVEHARSVGAEVVELDMARPFTAARARNEGFRRVCERMPAVQRVQFVDGDCEVVEGWLEAADAFLRAHPQAASVSGLRRERHPDRSVYNRLCDLEWRMPPGRIRSFGGDVMLRADALRDVGGYREDLIAGEEPELCVRLRAKGWVFHALDRNMTWHDAAMTRFRQWWLRIKRSGYAYAEGAHLHGAGPDRHRVRESRRAWLWGLALPLAIAGLALVAGPAWLALLAIYPLQVLRLYAKGQGSPRERWLRAVFHTLGRFPEVSGQMQFVSNRLLHRRGRLIEYK